MSIFIQVEPTDSSLSPPMGGGSGGLPPSSLRRRTPATSPLGVTSPPTFNGRAGSLMNGYRSHAYAPTGQEDKENTLRTHGQDKEEGHKRQITIVEGTSAFSFYIL